MNYNLYTETRHSGYQMVPCGKCVYCRQRRVNDWVVRLSAEDRRFLGGLFVTLTYSNEAMSSVWHDSYLRKTEKGFLTVNKRDVQLFMKRLRFAYDGKLEIKYYCAAEYGSETKRPHYHLIIYGADAETIARCWDLGSIYVGNVTGASIAYTLKYISKEKQVPEHANDDRTREFSLMSKHLGSCYLTPQMVRYHKNNLASYVTKEDGYKTSLPRYYRDKIFDEYEKNLIQGENQKRYLEEYDRMVAACGSSEEYYRLLGEHVRASQIELKTRQRDFRDKL